jgi:hypothetical protein
MSINIEQVEKLKERANVSYEDAKGALEQCGGDLLEAVIFLEKQGKVQEGSVGNFDSRSAEHAHAGNNSGQQQSSQAGKNSQRHGESFGDVMRKIWRFICRLLRKGNVNHFVVNRDGQCVLSIPVTLLVLFLLFFFYITLPALIIALFFGCSYRFRGPDLGKDNINDVMDGAADAAETLKRKMQESSEENSDTQK